MLEKDKLASALEEAFSDSKRNGDTLDLEDVPSFDMLCRVLTEKCGDENGGYFCPTDIHVHGIDHDWSVGFKHEGREYCVAGTMRYGHAYICKYDKTEENA